MSPAARRFVVALLSLCAADASAEMSVCADPSLSVAADSPAATARVCTAAVAAKAPLASCGLVQRAPITLLVLDEVHGISDHCAGLYRRGSDEIALLAPSLAARTLPQDSSFAGLAPDLYFDSLVTHEMAHALMDQALDGAPRCSADAEYIAYAMQLDSLPDSASAMVYAGTRDDGPVPADSLNAFVLFMNPDLFARLAWGHFAAPGNGCDVITDILSGARTFATPTLRK